MVGWFQGAIRQVLSIASLVVAFLVAAQLRDPLGDFLARNWTFYDRDFNFMLAFLGLWLAFGFTFQTAIQLFYHRVLIHARLALLDELLGGLLGAFQVVLVVSFLIAIFDSYYVGAGPRPGDIGWARSFEALLNDSSVAGQLRAGFLPGLLAVLGPLLPADVTNLGADLLA